MLYLNYVRGCYWLDSELGNFDQLFCNSKQGQYNGQILCLIYYACSIDAYLLDYK